LTDRGKDGSSSPLGPRRRRMASTSACARRHATGVELQLFDAVDDTKAARIIQLDPAANRTYYYWHVFVPHVRPGQLYAAPAVGNMHGMLASMLAGREKKRLDIDRIRAIKKETRIFMTLHGASGTDDDDLRRAIAAGMTVVHIDTEVRIAWREGLDRALAAHPQEVVPDKILPQVVDSVVRRVAARLVLFSGK
jgi:fructose/tagatose bisphosphate aldolase